MLKEILRDTITDTKKILITPKAVGLATGFFLLNCLVGQMTNKKVYSGILLTIITLVFYSYLTFYIAKIIQSEGKQLIENETTSFKKRLGRAAKSFFIAWLGFFGIAIFFIIFMMILGKLEGAIADLLIAMIYIIPSSIIFTFYICRISLIIPISVLSDAEKPIKTSIKMTKGNVWKIISTLMLPLIIFIINTIVSYLMIKQGIAVELMVLIALPLGTLVMLLYVITTINIYYHLRNKANIEITMTENL